MPLISITASKSSTRAAPPVLAAGDAIQLFVNKKSRVTLFLVETSGAISPRSLKYVAYLAARARGKGARDGTRYGQTRLAARTFYRHHTAAISAAVTSADATVLLN